MEWKIYLFNTNSKKDKKKIIVVFQNMCGRTADIIFSLFTNLSF